MPLEVFMAGPTAVGKSEAALLVAESLGAEIISVDSMQVYRGLDIGTAKPSAEERQRVRHHLIDVADPNEMFDAAKFVELASLAVSEIHGRNKHALFCGGTGLYFSAYLRGLGDAPGGDDELRHELNNTPLEKLCQEIAEKDPEFYKVIDKKNPRRIVRAVEVMRLTGKPYSSLRAKWNEDKFHPFIILDRPREDLHRRIEERVDKMFGQGLVAEVERLKGNLNKTAMQAIGYKQVLEHLDGKLTLSETIELVKTRTRQYAKRQLTWFRRETGAAWIKINEKQDARSIACQFKETLGSYILNASKPV